MPGTLALITTSHQGVACSNTPLLPRADKDCLGLDQTQPWDLKTIMEHPILLAGVLTILAKHHDQHMGPREICGTKITNLLVIIQEVDFLADNREETPDTNMAAMVEDLAIIQEEAMDHQVDPMDQEDLLSLVVI